jgi:hypothetical protein
MQRQQYRITDFAKLCQLFVGGYGQFHFFNTKTTTQFNLKFKALRSIEDFSQVSVCFVHSRIEQKLFYLHIGRYNFQKRRLELRTTQIVNDRQLRMFLETLDWVLNHINMGKPFESNVQVYYSGHCCACGKKLYDAVSLQRGMGECCAKKPRLMYQPVLFHIPYSGIE